MAMLGTTPQAAQTTTPSTRHIDTRGWFDTIEQGLGNAGTNFGNDINKVIQGELTRQLAMSLAFGLTKTQL